MKIFRIFLVLMMAGLLVAGCSQEADITAPETQGSYDKDGTEGLGAPEIPIADGSGFVEGGVGMAAGVPTGTLTFDVPVGAAINQVLLYWAGATTGAPGDDMISVDGNSVTGDLIGGPTNFFNAYIFYAYRADITAMGWVTDGNNSFEISDFDFDYTGGGSNENNGATMLVIYDDGTEAEITLRDGLDMAFFRFEPTLDATVPQTFLFAAEPVDRMADMVIFSGSVGAGRPNEILVTTSTGTVTLDDKLGSMDGPQWDSLILEVMVPAGDTSLTVELVSPAVDDPLGASMGWTGAGLSVPVTEEVLYCLGDYVWYDENGNGCQDVDEMPAEGIEVKLWEGCRDGIIATTVTNAEGYYDFCDLLPGDYTVQFVAPEGYMFCEPFVVECGTEFDSNADEGGFSDCVTIVDADDYTIDAALCEIPEEGCTYTIGKWKNWTGLGNGNQEDIVSEHLPITLGDEAGAKSLVVTDVYMAVDVLSQKVYGKPNNGITKLYAQMLAAKLNVSAGASDSDIAGYLADADAFLADYDYTDWNDLSEEMVDDVMMWHKNFDLYNNGDIGPGHCDDDDDDDDVEEVLFK